MLLDYHLTIELENGSKESVSLYDDPDECAVPLEIAPGVYANLVSKKSKDSTSIAVLMKNGKYYSLGRKGTALPSYARAMTDQTVITFDEKLAKMLEIPGSDYTETFQNSAISFEDLQSIDISKASTTARMLNNAKIIGDGDKLELYFGHRIKDVTDMLKGIQCNKPIYLYNLKPSLAVNIGLDKSRFTMNNLSLYHESEAQANSTLAADLLSVSLFAIQKPIEKTLKLPENFYPESLNNAFRNQDCTYVDTSNWDGSIVSDLTSAFEYCQNLKSIDLSFLNPDKSENEYIDSLDYAFSDCPELEAISGTKDVHIHSSSLDYLFQNDSSLIQINPLDVDNGQLKTMNGTFQNCSSLKELPLDIRKLSSIESMNYCFAGCKELNISAEETLFLQKLISVRGMFQNTDASLAQAAEHICSGKIKDAARMFENTTTGSTLFDLSSLNFDEQADCSAMFQQSQVKDILLSKLSSQAKADHMFTGSTVENIGSILPDSDYIVSDCNNLNAVVFHKEENPLALAGLSEKQYMAIRESYDGLCLQNVVYASALSDSLEFALERTYSFIAERSGYLVFATGNNPIELAISRNGLSIFNETGANKIWHNIGIQQGDLIQIKADKNSSYQYSLLSEPQMGDSATDTWLDIEYNVIKNI